MATERDCIVVAMDGDDASDDLLEHLDRFLDRNRDRLRVVTVVPRLEDCGIGFEAFAEAARRSREDVYATLTEDLAQTVRERVARFGLSPQSVTIRRGRPAEEICSFADVSGAGLIVVGSTTNEAFGVACLGSTASEVNYMAQCNVLTVRLDSR